MNETVRIRPWMADLEARITALEERLNQTMGPLNGRVVEAEPVPQWASDVMSAVKDNTSSLGRLLDTVRMLKTRIEALEERPPWTCYDCGLPIYGNHACGVAKMPDPEPVPKWRRLVGEVKRELENDTWPSPSPLALVLGSLELITHGYDGARLEGLLARIVAVCEAQVGNDWQADSSEIPAWRGGTDAWGLLSLFTYDDSTAPTTWDWQRLGNAAAAWLKSLTEADA